LTPDVLAALRYNWDFWARPNQLEPEGDWTTWLILAGRGFGKTRTGAETIRKWVCGDTPLSRGHCRQIALVAETAPDARDVMVEGPAGLLGLSSQGLTDRSTNRVNEELPGLMERRRLYLMPLNRTSSGDLSLTPLGATNSLSGDTLQTLGTSFSSVLRLGDHPRQIVTTTPRPIPVVRRLMADINTFVTRGRTYDNAANLAAPFLRQIEERYGGTRIGRQELEGEVLDDIPGALWNREIIDNGRVRDTPGELTRVVIAIDPAASSGEDADETGIVAVAVST
jgi:phage terminase large subunit-like protein